MSMRRGEASNHSAETDDPQGKKAPGSSELCTSSQYTQFRFPERKVQENPWTRELSDGERIYGSCHVWFNGARRAHEACRGVYP